MAKWIILLISACIMAFLLYHAFRFGNPHKLYMVIGKKGAGKSVTIAKLANKYHKKGYRIYSNMEINGIGDVMMFNPKEIGELNFKSHSVIFLDEVGLLFDNRKFKDFKDSTNQWFKFQRKYKCIVWLFSQSYDVDLKLRSLVDSLYLAENFCNAWAILKKVQRKITIVHASDKGESRIVDDLDWTPWYTLPFGGLIISYIPHWIRYFESYNAPVLKSENFTVYNKEIKRNVKFNISNSLVSVLRNRPTRYIFSKSAKNAVKNISESSEAS